MLKTLSGDFGWRDLFQRNRFYLAWLFCSQDCCRFEFFFSDFSFDFSHFQFPEAFSLPPLNLVGLPGGRCRGRHTGDGAGCGTFLDLCAAGFRRVKSWQVLVDVSSPLPAYCFRWGDSAFLTVLLRPGHAYHPPPAHQISCLWFHSPSSALQSCWSALHEWAASPLPGRPGCCQAASLSLSAVLHTVPQWRIGNGSLMMLSSARNPECASTRGFVFPQLAEFSTGLGDWALAD